MLSQPKNRVQAIKSKFENLGNDLNVCKPAQLNKQVNININNDKENVICNDIKEKECDSDTSSDSWSAKPNMSYLYGKSDIKRCVSDTKKALVRQSSDPGKKLHRSHAFRCDRSKIVSPKRHGSCNGRSETSDFGLKMGEKKLSKDRLKRLGNLLEDQMRKENFVCNEAIVGQVLEVKDIPLSIPDVEVPQHILDQYAKVVKNRRNDTDKQDGMTDSGVSSETENLDDDKCNRIKKLMNQFEKSNSAEESTSNLDSMNDLCASSETMRLERKNPHLTLTDTLKKALKQPLPAGPPPKKPPRTFLAGSPILESPEKQKKDTKKMLEKLEQVLQKREASKSESEVTEMSSSTKKPKEIHYLCTEILDITHKTLLPNSANCFKSLNCAITNNSTLSLPYTRLSSHRESLCSCNNDNIQEDRVLTTFLTQKCSKCQDNELKHDQYKCHLHCKCKEGKSQFFVDEHIYDEPFNEEESATISRQSGKSQYGTLNFSKSTEDLRMKKVCEDQKIYDIPCDVSRPETPENIEVMATEPAIPKAEDPKPKSDFERLRRNFENGFQNDTITNKNKPDRLSSGDKAYNANVKALPEDIISNVNEKIAIIDASKKIIIVNKPDDVAAKKVGTDKPPMKPKPVFVKNRTKSTENILEEIKSEKRFSTEGRRYRRERDGRNGRLGVPKKDSTQLDVDRENLNRLMNEIYDTVTAVSMADNKPGSFPTEHSDGSTSEDSVKLTRSLTEKRKNYVRRVSSRVAYLDPKHVKNIRFRHQTSICSYKSEIIDNPYSTFRSWKSFRTSQNNLAKMDRRPSTDSKVNLTDSKGNILSMADDFDSSDALDSESIDEKTGCVDISLPFEPRDRGLFNVCLLVGLNYMTGLAYVKSVFPSQVQVPPHIENLIFPETLSASKEQWTADAAGAQCYSLVLTDERGERSYGYCRRVLPEGATVCLPLCYCLIGKYRAPGFYYKVLQEIESHHGSSEVEIHSILQQLFETDFPQPGEEITISYSKAEFGSNRNSANLNPNSANFNRNSANFEKCKTMPDLRRGRSEHSDKSVVSSDKCDGHSDKCDSEVTSESVGDKLPDYYDLENNNSPKRVFLSFEEPRIKTLKRPIEPRVDEDNLSILLDVLGAGLTIKVFGSLLLERKVLIMGEQLSQVSSCLEALQTALYPLVWQQPLISAIPSEIQREVLEAPLPMLAGMLASGVEASPAHFQEGMLIDLSLASKVLIYQGDESTILPTASYKALKTALHMETKKDREDSRMRNVMISEAFLRFFVDILGDIWKYFTIGELKEGGLGKGDVVFDKEAFIKNAPSKQNQYFLEWFTETAMFNHFIQNMALTHRHTLNTHTLTRQLSSETSYMRQTSDTSVTSTSSQNTTSSSQNDMTSSQNNLTSSQNHLTPSQNDMTSSHNRLTSSQNHLTSSHNGLTSSQTSNVSTLDLVDAPLPDFYEIFYERIRSRSKTDTQKFDKNNYKNAMNKRMKLLKTKLRELVT